MSTLVHRLANRARIQHEISTLVVSSDGAVREAQQNETSDVAITAMPDMLPVPRDSNLRTWGVFSLGGYWVAEAFGISQYQVASSAVSAGLSPGATIGAVLLGHFIISLACAVNGYVGSRYGINFPSYARSAFGIRGTYLAVICRAIAAIIWFGTQTYQGGQCVQVMLCAIWPQFKHFPNHLPPDAHVTSSLLLCFFIFYIVRRFQALLLTPDTYEIDQVQLPLLWIHISKLRYLFMVKIVLMPIFGFVLFGWAVGRGGFGPVWSKPTKILDGRPVAVVFFSAMTSAIAPKATLSLNVCDFTRYAKSPRVVVWTNIISLTIPVTLCAILGVVVTSAAEIIYGVSTWSPLQVSSLMGNRAAQFFSAFMWALAVLSTNIRCAADFDLCSKLSAEQIFYSANSTAVGNDLMVMFPKYINIRRGQYITAILGLVTCPWIIQNSAKTFTAFLGGYSVSVKTTFQQIMSPLTMLLHWLQVFLAPVGGVLMTDYLLVHRRRISLPDLFIKQDSVYWYTSGWNLRAVAAFVLGIVPTLPGFIRNVNGSLSIPIGASFVFCVVYPVGVVVSGGFYLLFCTIWPVAILPSSYTQSASGSMLTEADTIEKEKDSASTAVVMV
ncbi:nucleobase:cation symporter-1, NCS1 family, partial [Phenoliferia sp. Uapishka_3]